MQIDMITLLNLVALVGGVTYFFQKPIGKRVGSFLPAPFWVYFLAIVLGTFGVLPNHSSVYGFTSERVLPAALFLMLVGAPVLIILKLGPKALGAMGLATASMFVATIISFLLFGRHLPDEPWRVAGTMLATWTGGSANMMAVKEVVGLSDEGLGPLIVADTFLSYGWLAFLVMGVAYEKMFDKKINAKGDMKEFLHTKPPAPKPPRKIDRILRVLWILAVGILAAEIVVWLGRGANSFLTFLSPKAWAILIVTTGAVILALTKARRLEDFGASDVGTFLLYIVLASMGARTDLHAAIDAPWVLVFGASVLILHGVITLFVGRKLKIPLFLLATSSQANVGGPVSAPIVAGVYRPGLAHLGVLLAILGAILGTYIGSLGGFLCRIIQSSLG